MNGTGGTSFMYPSAIGQFRKQFAYLEENGGKSGPVIPPERKHVSLPRSTVHSSTVTPIAQPNLLSYENRQTEEASNGLRVTDTINGNPSKASRPPPRVPTAKPGRVIGPVHPYEIGRNVNETYDPRTLYRHALLPQQSVSTLLQNSYCESRKVLVGDEERCSSC